MAANSARLPRLVLALFVLLAATSVGGLFGWVAGIIYMMKSAHSWLQPLGMAVGLAGGCITAALWLIAMFHEMSKPKPELVIRIGITLGSAAGVLTAAALHAALIAVTHRTDMIQMALMGVLVAGVPAGFIVGLAGGLAAWGVVKWEQRHG